jgi:hypothetical protein
MLFSLLLAGIAFLCLALIAFRRYLVIPWAVVDVIDGIAWLFGWQTYVRAIGGPGWHSGRFGAEAVYFIRRDPIAKRVPRIRASKLPFGCLAFMLAVVMLAGCANLQKAYDTVTSAKVPVKTIIVAANAFDGLKITAKNYIVYCSPVPAPTGCDDTVIQTKLIPAIKSGTLARNSLEDFLATHPGELGDKGLYDALTSANSTISAVVAAYKG